MTKPSTSTAAPMRDPQAEPLFQFAPDQVAVAVEQDGDHEEAPAARDDRAQDEQPDIVAGKARGDGHELVGDRRQPLQQDDHRAPFGIGGAEGLDLVAETVEIDEPVPDRIVEQRADRVSEHAAGHRRDRADGREPPCPLRPRQRHRQQHDIGRDREERAFREGYGRQNPERVGLVGGVDAPVVDPFQHGAHEPSCERICPCREMTEFERN